MDNQIIFLLFWGIFVVGFAISFKILQAIEIEKYFKKNRHIEIHAAYLIISTLTGYFLASFIVETIKLFPWN